VTDIMKTGEKLHEEEVNKVKVLKIRMITNLILLQYRCLSRKIKQNLRVNKNRMHVLQCQMLILIIKEILIQDLMQKYHQMPKQLNLVILNAPSVLQNSEI